MNLRDSNIAIIHDWFLKNSFGGAEKVSFLIDEFLEKNYSKPDLFSLVSNIKKSDKKNGNAYLAKSIINIYLLDKKDARFSITKTKNLEKSRESKEILKIVEGLTYLLEMQFINAYNSFAI